MPLVQRLSFVQNVRCSGHGVAVEHRLHVTAAYVDAHTYIVRAESERAYASQVLGKCERCAATEESENLTIALVYLHASLTCVGIGRRDELHAECVRESVALQEHFLYLVYIHNIQY